MSVEELFEEGLRQGVAEHLGLFLGQKACTTAVARGGCQQLLRHKIIMPIFEIRHICQGDTNEAREFLPKEMYRL